MPAVKETRSRIVQLHAQYFNNLSQRADMPLMSFFLYWRSALLLVPAQPVPLLAFLGAVLGLLAPGACQQLVIQLLALITPVERNTHAAGEVQL